MFLGSKIITQLIGVAKNVFQYLWSMSLEHSYVQKLQKAEKFSFSPEMKLIPSKATIFYCCTCSDLQWVVYQELL